MPDSGGRASDWAIDVGTETPIQTFYDGPLFDPLAKRAGLVPVAGVPPHGLPPGETDLSGLALAGTTHRLAVQPSDSFFGDCIHVVDAPDEQPLAPGFPPFGWSGADMLGGAALTASRLGGELELRFADVPDDDGKLPFSLVCPQPLFGGDGVLAAPDGYQLPTADNEVALVGPPSRGLLDRGTGRVYDFHLNCAFDNSAIQALLAENPSLDAPPLLFPGVPHSGHALAWFTLSEAGELQLHVAAQLFLPLGPGAPDAPLTLPGAPGDHASPFAARNSALHPFIYLSCSPCNPRPGGAAGSAARSGPSEALRAHENTTVRLLCRPVETCFGDDFDLVTDDLGGGALAQSPLFGEIEIQLGRIVDGFAPFTLGFAAPSPAWEPKFAPLLELLPPGTCPGLVGMRGELAFPKHSYDQRNLSLNSDPYKPSVGVVDVATGRFTLVLRKYLFQNLMLQLLMSEPRTPSDSFAYLAGGSFGAANGLLTLTLDGALFIPYPTGYRFPLPDGATTTALEGSRLLPFVRLDAIELDALKPLAPEQALRFAGAEHVRGRATDALAFEVGPVEPRSGRRRVSLRTGDVVVEGHGDVGRRLAQHERELSVGEFELEDGGVLGWYLSGTGERAQLQVISPSEEWDLWARGTVEQGPLDVIVGLGAAG